MVKYSVLTSEKCIEMRLSFLENRFTVVVVVAFSRLWPACFGFEFPKFFTHAVPNVITKQNRIIISYVVWYENVKISMLVKKVIKLKFHIWLYCCCVGFFFRWIWCMYCLLLVVLVALFKGISTLTSRMWIIYNLMVLSVPHKIAVGFCLADPIVIFIRVSEID